MKLGTLLTTLWQDVSTPFFGIVGINWLTIQTSLLRGLNHGS